MHPALRLFIYAALGYGILVLMVFLFQRKLIYFPDQRRPLENDIRAAGLRFWPQADQNYLGFIGIQPPDEPKGTVVAFHGNAGAAWHRGYYVHALAPLGYQVIAAEYPGYGGRSGAPGESAMVEDAKAILTRAYETFGGPLFLWGESLGCAVAAAAARKPPVPVKGMVMITPWDSLPALGQMQYWYLPARWMTRDKFDSVRNLQSFERPIAVLIAEHDEIIPRKCSMRLYESLTAPKKLWVFRDAGHNSWPNGRLEKWWREVMEFVSSEIEKRNV